MVFDDEAKSAGLDDSPHTTAEVRACFDDLKVLGKGDFKVLVKWRAKIRSDRQRAEREARRDAASAAGDPGDESQELTREEIIAQEEERMQERADAALDRIRRAEKRARKKAREKKIKQQKKADLGMLPGQGVDLPEDDDLFSLRMIKSAEALETFRKCGYVKADPSGGLVPADEVLEHANGSIPVVPTGEALEGEEYTAMLEAQMDHMYQEYKLAKSGKVPRPLTTKGQTMSRRKREEREAAIQDTITYEEEEERRLKNGYLKLLADNDDVDSGDEEAETEKKKKKKKKKKAANPLVADKAFKEADRSTAEEKAERWFSNEIFADAEDIEEDDGGDEQTRGEKKKKSKKARNGRSPKTTSESTSWISANFQRRTEKYGKRKGRRERSARSVGKPGNESVMVGILEPPLELLKVSLRMRPMRATQMMCKVEEPKSAMTIRT